MIHLTAPVVRRLVTVAAGLAGLAVTTVVSAGPVAAEPSEGWPASEPVDPLFAILLLAGIPLALFLAIVVATYLPALMRGENITPGGPSVEDQWLGGPRTSGELAAPDSETSVAGGASGRW
ncbi:MAG: hypothetical protein WB471_00975 [Nocardioides sp.]